MEHNIIQDAYYLITLFYNFSNKPTQLHIQKLMFLFECYYMNVENVDRLYDCDFQAWNFGPVAIPLYKEFKVYGKDNIELTGDKKQWASEIPEEIKQRMNELYEAFKGFSAIELVNFTHAVDSPWHETWNRKKYSIISKVKMKDWFSKYVR